MMQETRKPSRKMGLFLLTVLLAVLFLYPVAWMLSTALKAPEGGTTCRAALRVKTKL